MVGLNVATFASPAAVRYLGYKRSEILTPSWKETVLLWLCLVKLWFDFFYLLFSFVFHVVFTEFALDHLTQITWYTPSTVCAERSSESAVTPPETSWALLQVFQDDILDCNQSWTEQGVTLLSWPLTFNSPCPSAFWRVLLCCHRAAELVARSLSLQPIMRRSRF